jgi:hypothetical protein
MGSPIFFGETQLYKPAAREKIRAVLRVYKRCRDDMFGGYVFPIGRTPDDSAWTGFQDVVSAGAKGYLLIFRERKNRQASAVVRLHFISDRFVVLTDLLSGQKRQVYAGNTGCIRFAIDKPADFRFYRYEVLTGAITGNAENEQRKAK